MSDAAQIDTQNAEAVCGALQGAAEANYAAAGRSGCVVDLPREGRMLITGDLHDHRGNFEAILKLARLDAAGDRHLVVQEVIHSDHLINGMDLSYRVMAKLAALIVAHPNRVHYLLSNHELAQARGEGIMKDGGNQIEAFDRGLEYVFGDAAEEVRDAVMEFVWSMPLAVRCANGVFCSHSLPPARRSATFDKSVLERELTGPDFESPGGDAYQMLWGRRITQEWADELAAAWGVKWFVLGHEKAEYGWLERGETMLTLNSDHEHGVALPIDLSRDYERDELFEAILPLAGV